MTAADPGDDPGRADRIAAKVATAPRLTASTRARLADLLDTADLGPRRVPVTRDRTSPASDMSAAPVAADDQDVMSATGSDHGRNAKRAQDDR